MSIVLTLPRDGVTMLEDNETQCSV